MNEEIKSLGVGVFNGIEVVTHDGRFYPVHPNYISKSRLVEGDVIKVIRAEDGRIFFKQLKPVERVFTKAVVVKNEDQYLGRVGNSFYRLPLASITYFKIKEGQTVTIVIPKNSPATNAAVENVVDDSDIDQEL